MIILIGSNRGGSGKSTTAINLAVAISALGRKVSLVDADPQASAAKWTDAREESKQKPYIHLVQMSGKIHKQLIEHSANYDVVIVDVAGRSSTEMITAFFVADILISPAQASQFDLDQLHKLQELSDQAPNLDKRYILQSMATTHATRKIKDRTEFKQCVAEVEGFEVLHSALSYRKSYQDSIKQGLSAIETKDEQAAFEVNKLAKEIIAIVEREEAVA